MANCLYNGIILPELPEKSSHMVISREAAFVITFKVFFLSELTYGSSDLGYGIIAPSGTRYYEITPSINSSWGDALVVDSDDVLLLYYGNGMEQVEWTNADILNEDGTVFLAATDPISLANQTVIEWDGVTDGLESTTYNGLTYYRVADGAPSIKQLKGGYTVVSSTSDELGTVLTTGVNAEYDYFEDSGIYGADPWLVKDGAVWLQRYTDGADEVQYISLLSYATVVADIDPVAFMTGFQLGQAIRGAS